MPLQLKMTINGLDKASDELLRAVSIGEANGLETIGIEGARLVASMTPVGATGNLVAGMIFEVHGTAVEIFATPPADVYSEPVDLGTKPHFPPTDQLLLWVKKKFGVTDEKQARSIAFLIARKISKRGTKPVLMFERAFDQLQQQGPEILEAEVAKAVQAAGFGGQ
jgi:hypothetical protein